MSKTHKQRYGHSHADHHKPIKRGLTRKQKNLFHGLMLAIIALLLIHEGAQLADWGFLALAVVVEMS